MKQLYFVHTYKKISDDKYYSMLDFLYDRTDTITFFVDEEESSKFPSTEAYQFIKRVEPFIMHQFVSNNYASMIYEYRLRIFVVRFTTEVLKLLKEVNSFSAWRYPVLPEDLCFYKDKYCLASTIAHENFCSLSSTDDEIVKFCKGLKIGASVEHYFIPELDI